MSDFYRNVKLVKEVVDGKDHYFLSIKTNDCVETRVKLKADELEYIIAQYRFIK